MKKSKDHPVFGKALESFRYIFQFTRRPVAGGGRPEWAAELVVEPDGGKDPGNRNYKNSGNIYTS